MLCGWCSSSRGHQCAGGSGKKCVGSLLEFGAFCFALGRRYVHVSFRVAFSPMSKRFLLLCRGQQYRGGSEKEWISLLLRDDCLYCCWKTFDTHLLRASYCYLTLCYHSIACTVISLTSEEDSTLARPKNLSKTFVKLGILKHTWWLNSSRFQIQ